MLRNSNRTDLLSILGAFVSFLVLLALFHHFYLHTSRDGRGKDDVWLIGKARKNITPHERVWLSGYASRNRTADSIEPLDPSLPLYARAISLTYVPDKDFVSEENRLVIVSLDVVGIAAELSDRIYSAAHHRHALTRAQLRICVTHTHSGPIVGENLAPLAPDEDEEKAKIRRYANELVMTVLETIKQSLEFGDADFASAHYGTAEASLAVNRRQIAERKYDGVNRGDTEDNVPVLWFEAHGDVVAGLFGYAAHATVLTTGNRYYGDYPGVACGRLEKEYKNSVWLYMPSCGGDQNIYPRGTQKAAEDHAHVLVDSVMGVVHDSGLGHGKNVVLDRSKKPMAAHTFVPLPFVKRYAEKELQVRARSKAAVERKAARRLLKKLEPNGLTEREYNYPIAVWQLTPVVIAFLGGEPTVGYCSKLREAGVTWVVGYCEDVMGYVGTADVVVGGSREGGERAAWYYGLPAAWSRSVEGLIISAVRRLIHQGNTAAL